MFQNSVFLQHFPYLSLCALLLLGGFGLPFPEEAILITAGFLIAQGIVGKIPALLVIFLSVLAADFMLYSVGKRYGFRLIEHRTFQRVLSPDTFAKFQKRFDRRGTLWVFLGRFAVGVRAQIFLMAGVTRLPAARFLIADLSAALISIPVMVWVGYAGGNSLKVMRNDFTRIEHVIIVGLVLGFIAWIFYHHVKHRKTAGG